MTKTVKYFNEKVPFSFLGFDSSFFHDEGGFYANGGDPIRSEDYFPAVELIVNSRYIHNNFYDFLDIRIFDPSFIRTFYLHCFDHALSYFKQDLTSDLLTGVELYKKICAGEESLISNQEAKDLSKTILDNLKKENELFDHLVFFTRAICSSLAMGERHNSAMDCAAAIARYLGKNKDQDDFAFNDHQFLRAWRTQKIILINDIFENYPEQTAKYLDIKNRYHVKELLRL